MSQGFNLDKSIIGSTRNPERSSHKIHKYFLKQSKGPFLQKELNTYSVALTEIGATKKAQDSDTNLFNYNYKNKKYWINQFGPLAIKILGNDSGPSSFSIQVLSSMAATICQRISSDCLVQPLVIGPCIWAALELFWE